MGAITPIGSDSYKDEILDLLKDIAGNSVGRVIFAAALLRDKKLSILPFNARQGFQLSCAAHTSPSRPSGIAPKGVGPKEQGRLKWYDGREDDEDTDKDERHNAVNPSWVATGEGSDIKLYFTPGEWGNTGCRGGAFGAMPDEILLHEMVHAVRMMQGVFNPIPTLSMRHKNEEEFLAVVVTNVYMSQKGKAKLRKDYVNAVQLEPPYNTSAGFLLDDEHKTILTHHSKFWQPAFADLGAIAAPFNPFSQFKAGKL